MDDNLRADLTRMMIKLAPPVERPESDLRQDAPTFHRNARAILEALAPRLRGAAPAVLLEIGSGTGQHAALLAGLFPHLAIWPSDPDPRRRAGIEAWRADLGLANLRPPLDLDCAAPVGWPGAAPDPVGAVFSANMVHIAPWAAAEGLFARAAQRLAPGGVLALYGPFAWEGRHIAESNAAFDASLKERDPSWGVRDVVELDRLAAENGLQRIQTIAMPSNNHVLVFSAG